MVVIISFLQTSRHERWLCLFFPLSSRPVHTPRLFIKKEDKEGRTNRTKYNKAPAKIQFISRHVCICILQIDLWRINWNSCSYKVISATKARAVIDSRALQVHRLFPASVFDYARERSSRKNANVAQFEAQERRRDAAASSPPGAFSPRDRMSRENSLWGRVAKFPWRLVIKVATMNFYRSRKVGRDCSKVDKRRDAYSDGLSQKYSSRLYQCRWRVMARGGK